MWNVLWPIIYVVAHACLLVRAITRPNRAPAARVAWVAVILAIPVVGFISYLALGETDIGGPRVRRLREAEEALEAVPTTAVPADVHEPARPMSDLLRSINGYAPVAGNRIELLGDPEAPASEPKRDSVAAIEAMIAAIGEARQSVHLSFYIWLDDVHGGKVADAVAAAARRGVVCRVMADALGSRAFIASKRWQQLKDAGVHLLATLDDIPRLGHLAVGRVDLRNHRKVVVIDGAVAFCGSQNCADPEFRPLAKYAPWIDLWFRCEGPIVEQAQRLFLATWMAESDDDLGSLVQVAPDPFSGGVVAQMYGTGPTTPGNAMSDSFVTALYTAREELIITSPYFGPDEALLHAVCAAPRRGVKTVFITPANNNSWAVAASARSTYSALLNSGAEIYEYPLGLLHSKSITIDGRIALVGSANLDRRSLDLNFENNLLILDPSVTADVRRRQLGYQSQSTRVTDADVRRWGLWRRLFDNTIAMASPVL
ncbi:MAG TPA: cardiolipin synthase [Nocardioides sp.]|nr:cardiolipin synthase [Nocardioides sp.]